MDVLTNNISQKISLDLNLDVPHIIKYMGSKRGLLKQLGSSINEIYDGETICDLFAGTCVLSGALGHQTSMISNDIQEYSSILANTYLGSYDWDKYPDLTNRILAIASKRVDYVLNKYPDLVFNYESDISLIDFNNLEKKQQSLIHYNFNNIDNYLFIKNYSGTYWSFEQCLWIDSIRIAAEEFRNSMVYYPIISSLMYAMAYNAQSTGHYAQYREANSLASMNDIYTYRTRNIAEYFKRKLDELINKLGLKNGNHQITTLDYRKCLDRIPNGTLVYADPPYAFVHYSRFYHAIETLVKYDYPEISFKGRYRNDRHQSPFCKRTQVKEAFRSLFHKIRKKESKLVLSYSNTGMISLKQILDVANDALGSKYFIKTNTLDHTHSTMGRSEDRLREVKEYIISFIPIS